MFKDLYEDDVYENEMNEDKNEKLINILYWVALSNLNNGFHI